MIDDGNPPKSASEAPAVFHANSCWLSTKPWVIASRGSKSPISLYTTTCAFDVYKLVPERLAITTNGSTTLGSGTRVQRGGSGKLMSSAVKSSDFCGSSATPLLCR